MLFFFNDIWEKQKNIDKIIIFLCFTIDALPSPQFHYNYITFMRKWESERENKLLYRHTPHRFAINIYDTKGILRLSRATKFQFNISCIFLRIFFFYILILLLYSLMLLLFYLFFIQIWHAIDSMLMRERNRWYLSIFF